MKIPFTSSKVIISSIRVLFSSIILKDTKVHPVVLIKMSWIYSGFLDPNSHTSIVLSDHLTFTFILGPGVGAAIAYETADDASVQTFDS